MRLASISPGGERVRLWGLLLLADSGQHLGGVLHLFCWRRAKDGGLWVEVLFSQATLKGEKQVEDMFLDPVITGAHRLRLVRSTWGGNEAPLTTGSGSIHRWLAE
ncbi:hypothetical protein EYF80_031386 [Liparis tanakae]|uniref:Uncharacterized protein n=1 Tax=Liparis tanakae TaxID=230148 RepID=A0A4Z2GZ53_9TELE|nr:hypothetical protein EYF80_031386 [Liparis tanakae]